VAPPQPDARVGKLDPRINSDAQLCARLIRNYSKDWVDGAGRFAALYLPYLLDQDEAAKARKQHEPWSDAQDAGIGGLPAGLTEIEDGEASGAIHPAHDPAISGLPVGAPLQGQAATDTPGQDQAAGSTGNKSQKEYRGPAEYGEILKATGTNVPQHVIIARYYKELAVPHLIQFPTREVMESVDPVPEGLDTWESGAPIENIDWMATLTASPVVIPGFTTRERLYGTSTGSSPETLPVDLYLGVDCSGSMHNPAQYLSYPVLAAAVIALSALRAKASVVVALSGEPGKTITTDGFIRDEQQILGTLTDYLGTGTTFGIHRLHPTFSALPANHRPVHILIITDNDIFGMLDSTVDKLLGWDAASEAVRLARGGATYVLQISKLFIPQGSAREAAARVEARMQTDGWHVSHVSDMEELMVFARAFSQAKYHKEQKPRKANAP
jgi:hypothetical protein